VSGLRAARSLIALVLVVSTATVAPAAVADAPSSGHLAFVSPQPGRLTGTVDVQVQAPVGTTAVRFSVDDVALSEITDTYFTETGLSPVWRTATDASYFPPGRHVLRAEADTPSGTVSAAETVTTTRPPSSDGRTSLDGGWHFARAADLPAGDLDAAVPPEVQPGYDDSALADVVVPDSFGAVRDAWNDDAGAQVLYRRAVDLPARPNGVTTLITDNCFFACRYFVNGVAVGTSSGGYLPAKLDVSAALRKGSNTIAVIADNRVSTLGVFAQPNKGNYWNWGGLIQDVWLQHSDPAALTEMRAEGTMTGALTVRPVGVNHTGVARSIPARLWVTDAQGRMALAPRIVTAGIPDGGGSGDPITAQVPNPKLWDLDHPTLYTVHLQPLGAQGPTLTEPTGFRTVAVQGEDLLLNGRVVRDLQGFDRHADYPGLGRTQPDGLADREIKTLHDKGFRIFRPAHYPTTPAELAAADKYGLLVVEEINQITSLSATVLAQPSTQEFAEQQLTRMVARDASHPSLIAFSVGNENDTTSQKGADYVKNLVAFGKSLEPTRLYTAVTNHTTSDLGRQYVDFLAENYYAGWYSGAVDSVVSMLDAVQAQEPKPVLITEYGAEGVRGRDGTARGSEWYQASIVDGYNRLLAGRPHLIGKLYWTSTEFWCTPTWSGGNPDPIPPFHAKALVDYFRTPKLGWRVMFSPVRITDASQVDVPAGAPTTSMQRVTVTGIGDHTVSGRLVADPPAGFHALAEPTFKVAPGQSQTLDVPLAGTLDPSVQTESGFTHAVVDSDTEALPAVLTVKRVDTAATTSSDTFDSPTLDTHWQIVRPDSAGWSLTDRPGSLRLSTLPGDEYGQDNDGGNLFMRTGTPAVDLTATAAVSAPGLTADAQQVGLLLYADDDNYAKIDFGVSKTEAPVVQFTSEVHGGASASTSVPYAGSHLRLRLVRRGPTVTGEYSPDGQAWYPVASGTGPTNGNVALQAVSGNTGAPVVPTYVDDVTVTTSGGVDLSRISAAQPLPGGEPDPVSVTVANGTSAPASAHVDVAAPSDWTVSPIDVTLQPYTSRVVNVTVSPPVAPAGATLTAAVQPSAGLPVYGAAAVDVDTAPAAAAVPLAMDAGCASSPLYDGYQRLTEQTAWADGAAYGWVGTAPMCRDRGSSDALRRDLITNTAPGTLRVELPAGQHDIAVLVGDTGFPSDPMTMSVNGTVARTTTSVPAGQFTWYRLPTPGGTVDLTFAAVTDGQFWRINAVVGLP
jgi:beta-glucuronidase